MILYLFSKKLDDSTKVTAICGNNQKLVIVSLFTFAPQRNKMYKAA